MSVEITSKVNNDKPDSITRDTEFPFLMRTRTSGKVVLFFDENSGTVVDRGSSRSKELCFSVYYISCFNSDIWETVEEGTEYDIKITAKGYNQS